MMERITKAEARKLLMILLLCGDDFSSDFWPIIFVCLLLLLYAYYYYYYLVFRFRSRNALTPVEAIALPAWVSMSLYYTLLYAFREIPQREV